MVEKKIWVIFIYGHIEESNTIPSKFESDLDLGFGIMIPTETQYHVEIPSIQNSGAAIWAKTKTLRTAYPGQDGPPIDISRQSGDSDSLQWTHALRLNVGLKLIVQYNSILIIWQVRNWRGVGATKLSELSKAIF